MISLSRSKFAVGVIAHEWQRVLRTRSASEKEIAVFKHSLEHLLAEVNHKECNFDAYCAPQVTFTMSKSTYRDLHNMARMLGFTVPQVVEMLVVDGIVEFEEALPF